MLTKEERAAIAERLRECDYLYDDALYQILFGRNVPSDTTFEDDSKAILERLTYLCDTSNIIELPRDNDGEVIKVGDMVFNKHDYRAYRVRGYMFKLDRCAVMLGDDTNDCSVMYLEPVALIHKKTSNHRVTYQRAYRYCCCRLWHSYGG